MATGDIRGNIAQLQRLLRHIKYPDVADEVGYDSCVCSGCFSDVAPKLHSCCHTRLRLGDPLAVLPLLSYALLKYSKYVATHILKLGYQVTVLNTQQHKAAATAAAAAAP